MSPGLIIKGIVVANLADPRLFELDVSRKVPSTWEFDENVSRNYLTNMNHIGLMAAFPHAIVTSGSFKNPIWLRFCHLRMLCSPTTLLRKGTGDLIFPFLYCIAEEFEKILGILSQICLL
jgi:hypothetical protein